MKLLVNLVGHLAVALGFGPGVAYRSEGGVVGRRLVSRAGSPAPRITGGCVYDQPSHADAYDADRYGRNFGKFLETSEVELFCEMIGDNCESVLDLGTGTGKLAVALLSQGRTVTAVDSSPEMLRLACQKAMARRLSGGFVVGDALALGVKDRSVDCTVASRLFMHLKDWREAIAETCRVTRGMVVIDFPPRWSLAGLGALLQRALKGARARVRSTPSPDPLGRSHRAFAVGPVAEEFERCGFCVARVERSYFLPILFHRWLNRPRLTRKIERVFEKLGLVRRFGAPVTLSAVRREHLNRD